MVDAPEPPPREPPPLIDFGLAVLLTVGYGAPLAAGLVAAPLLWSLRWLRPLAGAPVVGLGIVLTLVLAVVVYRRIRRGGRARARRFAEVLILGVLPLWGLAYNHFLAEPSCEVSCGGETFRPLAEPEVFGAIALHLVSVVAYAITRRRPASLPRWVEASVLGALAAAVVMDVLLAVQFRAWILLALMMPPVLLPAWMPVLGGGLYAVTIVQRLRRAGIAAGAARGAVASAVVLGLQALVHALWLGRADGLVRVVTRTCDHTFSTVPVVITGHCHYLCTVAARGHAWLVRPERLGMRRGVVIVVNRQLAVANAFEDWLHETWPRFGRLARAIYDRVGLPISRWLLRPWLADVTYLVMKPFEWGFYVALALGDRGDPEDRIARMYRG